MSFMMPFTVNLPITSGADAAKIHTPTALEVQEISGSLNTLALGTLSVIVKDQDDAEIGQLDFTTGDTDPVLTIDPAYAIPAGGYLVYDIGGIGVGALGLYVTVWALGN